MPKSAQARTPEPFAQGCADHLRAPQSNPLDGGETSVVSRGFQRFQRVDVQFLGDAFRKLRPDARDRPEPLFRLERPAKPPQLRPSSGRQHLGEGGPDRAADGGQRHQGFAAAGGEDFAERAVETLDDVGCVLVSRHAKRFRALLTKQLAIFTKHARHDRVLVQICR